ncbi:MAG: hypothetical protein ACTSRA_05850 [Promethearchaeota archaeon]
MNESRHQFTLAMFDIFLQIQAGTSGFAARFGLPVYTGVGLNANNVY